MNAAAPMDAAGFVAAWREAGARVGLCEGHLCIGMGHGVCIPPPDVMELLAQWWDATPDAELLIVDLLAAETEA
jgi:hypothetical protein